jgi:Arc/MetJ family transcription regulator
MRTTVVLDDELVAQAREVLGGKSLRAMIEESLREAIRARHREALRRALWTGELELAITEEDLKVVRRDRHPHLWDDDSEDEAAPGHDEPGAAPPDPE